MQMMFLRHVKAPSNNFISSHDEDPTSEKDDGINKLPAIWPRSGMGFYLIDLFQVLFDIFKPWASTREAKDGFFLAPPLLVDQK